MWPNGERETKACESMKSETLWEAWLHLKRAILFTCNESKWFEKCLEHSWVSTWIPGFPWNHFTDSLSWNLPSSELQTAAPPAPACLSTSIFHWKCSSLPLVWPTKFGSDLFPGNLPENRAFFLTQWVKPVGGKQIEKIYSINFIKIYDFESFNLNRKWNTFFCSPVPIFPSSNRTIEP